MAAQNPLLKAPPYEVEQALKVLGANLRTARLARGLTLQEAGDKIGAGVRAVADAEKGKPSTAAAVYVALLWAMGLIDQLGDVAAPGKDAEGLALTQTRRRGGRREILDNDF